MKAKKKRFRSVFFRIMKYISFAGVAIAILLLIMGFFDHWGADLMRPISHMLLGALLMFTGFLFIEEVLNLLNEIRVRILINHYLLKEMREKKE